MRGVSAATLDQVLSTVESSKGSLNTTGDELFAVTALLDETPALRRMLTDPSTESEARVGLVSKVFSDKVGAATLEVLVAAVGGRWSAGRDLTDALEVAGVAAHVAAAGQLEAMETELFEVARIIDGDRELRQTLSDRTIDAAAKSELVDTVFGTKAAKPTVALVRQAVAARTGSFDKVLKAFADEVAARRSRLLAEVRTAYELSDSELKRLAAALGKRYGHELHLNTIIDPAVVGGIRVSVGGDVIDGTVSSRLEDARRRIAG